MVPTVVGKRDSGFIFENEEVRLMKAKLMKVLFVIVALLLAGGAHCRW